MAWQGVIGLEVHAQLRTRSKIFCACPTTFGAAPNAHTCPVCLGHPGALPVLNERAVRLAVVAGLALDCAIATRSRFDRKNYFYPDLPKGYQITQVTAPLCTGGHLDVATAAGVVRGRIHHIHLEEDAGKSIHDASPAGTLVDLNRAGTPLIEIVGEPDLRSADDAVAWLRELRAILRHTGVCDGNMEEGSLRCDANVSVHRPNAPFGTRCEIKNLNSFRAVRDAIAHEIERQQAVIDAGGVVLQQTRLWDAERSRTLPMRSKEEAHDYRYFPEPDLLPLHVAPELVAELRAALPELPAARRARWSAAWGVPAAAAAVLCDEPVRADAFERALGAGPAADLAAAFALFVTGQVQAAHQRSARTDADVDAALPVLLDVCARWVQGRLTNKMLADVLQSAFGGDAALGAELERALAQVGAVVTDAGALAPTVDAVLAEHADQAARYRAGHTPVLGFFVGQVMRRLGGRGDAQAVQRLLQQRLDQ
ncbi:MAG: Asp-tRNA(Asn)/Glu-tRNA(Gln) amidotransferase subunit GatB [Myxococcales bacterium]|nr:Asp-tRNA(Asn)/Glu-tRNA(Gln) amidotransferase subunit GatB [Myxococcales bacterium]